MTFSPFLLCVLPGGMVRSHTVRIFPPYPQSSISIPGQERTRAVQVFKKQGGEEGSLSSPSLFLLSLCGWDWLDVPQIIYSSLSTQEDCFLASLPVKLVVSLVVQMVKNLPVMQEIRVQSLGQEDPLEKGMATHSSILAWRSPWTEQPGGLWLMGSQRVRHYWSRNTLCVLVTLASLLLCLNYSGSVFARDFLHFLSYTFLIIS